MSDPRRQRCGSPAAYSVDCSGAIPFTAYKWTNESTMTDENDATVAPFERLEQWADVCNTEPTDCDDSPCLSELPDADVRAALPANTTPGAEFPKTHIIGGNTYTGDGTKVDFSCLPNVGFKNVQAFKAWHGAWPMDHDFNGLKCGQALKFWNGEEFIATPIPGVTGWNSSVQYQVGNLVFFNGLTYSALAVNSANQPDDSGSWALYSNYSSGTTYAENDVVFVDGVAYRSMQGSNQNNDPESSSGWWQVGGIPNLGNTKYRQMVQSCTRYRRWQLVFEDANTPANNYDSWQEYTTDLESTITVNRTSGKIDVSNVYSVTTDKSATGEAYQISTDSGHPHDPNRVVDLWNHPMTKANEEAFAVATLPPVVRCSDKISVVPIISPFASVDVPRDSEDLSAALMNGIEAILADTEIGECGTPLSGSDGEYTWIYDLCEGNTDTHTVTITIHSFTATATSYEFDIEQQYIIQRNATEYNTIQTRTFTWRDTVSIELSVPHTLTDVRNDVVTLLDEWNLADNGANNAALKKYLLRTDEHVFLAPFVTHYEKSATDQTVHSPSQYFTDNLANPVDWVDYGVNPPVSYEPFTAEWNAHPTWERMDWFDTLVSKWKYPAPANQTEVDNNELIPTGEFTGAIQGSPLPFGYGYAGTHAGHFNPFHVNWERAFCVGQNPKWLDSNMSHGAWTPSVLPKTATQWTEDLSFADLQTPTRIWPCSFLFGQSSGIYAQKFVEAIVTRPSHDFARPYGADRFLLDETKCYCVDGTTLTGYEGGTEEVTPTDEPLNTNLASGLWGGPCVGGFYSGCSYSGGTLTLGTKVLDVPTGWESKSGDTATVFGKLRWELDGNDVPGFGGLLAVTPTATGGSTTLVYASSPNIVTGDKVDLQLADGTWNDNSGAGFALTRIDDTSATVPGEFPTARYIVPHKLFGGTTSGQKWYFADSQPKGDYVWREWESFASDPQNLVFSNTATQKCLPFKPCHPRIVGASPNPDDASGEWPNAVIESFPATISNGHVWIGMAETHMVDPFWQTPHRPCGMAEQDNWQQDNGSCQTETGVQFYPLPPFVESRISTPATYGPAHNETAPTPPAPINLGAAELPVSQSSTPLTAGNIGFTFDGNSATINPTIPTPWGIYLRQKGCVCSESPGQFSTQYEANYVTC